MPEDSLVPRSSDALVRRGPGTPARAAATAPVHHATPREWSSAALTREQCWERLNQATRDAVDRRLGRLLEWWATDHEEHIIMVALGTRALVAVNPTVDAMGAPASLVSTMRLDEASFRSATIRQTESDAPPVWRTTQGQPATTVGPGAVGPGQRPGGPTGQVPRISPAFTGFIGMLPARAQHLIQEPFLTGTDPLDSDFFALRHAAGRGVGATFSIRIWCYLTDRKRLTFCAGVGNGYDGSTVARSWELTCWRADVVPRTAVR